MESDGQGVSRADDGTRLAGSAIFLTIDFNIVVPTSVCRLQIKTLEGEHDLLTFLDLQVPGLTQGMGSLRLCYALLNYLYLVMIVWIIIWIVWSLDLSLSL